MNRWLSKKFHTILLSLSVCLFFINTGTIAQADAMKISIEIARPGEGEVFYSGPTTLHYNIAINGWVQTQGIDIRTVTVLLEIFKEDTIIGTMRTQPDDSGFFEFFTNVNPGNSSESFPPGLSGCGTVCHYQAPFDLAPGKLLIRATAFDPSGNLAFSDRRIIVDHSQMVSIPVKIQLSNADQFPMEKVPVNASTWLYLWRTRHAVSKTDENGVAWLKAEALQQTSTNYIIQVEPCIVDGIFYESIEPIHINIPPGIDTVEQVTLTLNASTAVISGHLRSNQIENFSDIPVWAIQSTNGEYFKTKPSKDGLFIFPDVPYQHFVIVADKNELLKRGFSSQNVAINLFDYSHNNYIDIEVVQIDNQPLYGAVLNEDGIPLPFAWIEVQGTHRITKTSVATGEFIIEDPHENQSVLIIRAPGYYSQARIVDNTVDTDTVVQHSLKPVPDLRHIPWGSGNIYLPPESSYELLEEGFILSGGWVWGEGKDTDPIKIITPHAILILTNGKFALELIPGKPGWFYIFEGEAFIYMQNHEKYIPIHAGQMVYLDSTQKPVPVTYEPIVVDAIHSTANFTLPHVWEPSLGAQIRDRSARAGIGTAQLVTLVTYFAVLTSIVVFPLIGLYWGLKHNLLGNKYKFGKNGEVDDK